MSMVSEAIADMYQDEIDALKRDNLKMQDLLEAIYLDGMRNHRVRCMPWWKQLTELKKELK